MRRGAALILAMAVVLVVAGCGSSSGTGSAPASGPSPSAAVVSAGHRGNFLVECAFSHRSTDDPIVFPGAAGRSHSHDYFGNTGTDAASTLRSLRAAAATSCRLDEDQAAYWVPTLYRGDQPLTPLGIKAYYRPALGSDAARVQPYPEGLQLLAGDPHATSPQPLAHVGWTCGDRPGDHAGDLHPAPPRCSPDLPLSLQLRFPDCWDGRHLASTDHRSHVAYSRSGRCPATHPVLMPELLLIVRWDDGGDPSGLRLASGSTGTAHGDFFNAWEPDRLEQEVRLCIRRSVVCAVGVTGGLEGAAPP